jgi:methylated-DNA-[protein]-cysteine S-methyltransferase
MMMTIAAKSAHHFHVEFASPIGQLLAIANDQGIVALHMLGSKNGPGETQYGRRDPHAKLLCTLQKQLDEYFAGERQVFDLPLAPIGTVFQLQVWRALLEIPFGETRSYGQQANAIARPKAVRAVGAANGRNPIAVIVPCHRVIGGDGTLTGYAGGLSKKEFLLRLERRVSGVSTSLSFANEKPQQIELGFF